MAGLANQKVKQVNLLLDAGRKRHERHERIQCVAGMPFELITHNVGNVDSIGNVVFLAGTRRYAVPHATFMFHGVGFNAPPNQRLEEAFLKRKAGRNLGGISSG